MTLKYQEPKCCPHPDVDNHGQCQTCFTKYEYRLFMDMGLIVPNPREYLRRHSLITRENAYLFMPENPSEGLLKELEEYNYSPRYGGYYENTHMCDAMRYSLLAAAGLERPVDRVWDRVWSALCVLVVVAIACFVAGFMRE